MFVGRAVLVRPGDVRQVIGLKEFTLHCSLSICRLLLKLLSLHLLVQLAHVTTLLLSELEVRNAGHEYLYFVEPDGTALQVSGAQNELHLVLAAINRFDVGQCQIEPVIVTRRHSDRFTFHHSDFDLTLTPTCANFDSETDDYILGLLSVQRQDNLGFTFSVIGEALILLGVEQTMNPALKHLREVTRNTHLFVKSLL